MVDPVVFRFRVARSDVRDAGEVHDGVHAGEQGAPVHRGREVRKTHDVDGVGEGLCTALAHACAHLEAVSRERRRERASNHTGRAGDQNLHRLLRAKVVSSQATIAPPRARVARSTRRSGSIALTRARTASATLRTKMRTTVSTIEKPLSLAR